MARFVKKPIEIEARQVHPPPDHPCNCQDLVAWIGMNAFVCGDGIAIDTLEGQMIAVPGDWIICGVKGEFYPCKPDIFEASYQPSA